MGHENNGGGDAAELLGGIHPLPRFAPMHGGYGIGKRTAEGRMLLDFCDQKEMCVANTW